MGLISLGIALASVSAATEATMLRWKRPQRVMLADKLPDTANLALGALVFGQFLGDRFSVVTGLAGIVLWVFFMAMAARFAGDVR